MYDNHPIVIVDDHHEYRALVAQAFKTAGCPKEVIPFESGKIFLQFLNGIPRNEFPSLVMLNLDMHLPDDPDVLKEIKANPRFRQIPVIAYSQNINARVRENAFAAGANCFLIKTDNADQIVETLSSVILLWCLQ